jgi:hypothetical protein
VYNFVSPCKKSLQYLLALSFVVNGVVFMVNDLLIAVICSLFYMLAVTHVI